ncbi:AraC family transcriptional regulator [Sulfuricurvum sp.]|uniref:AraC family transcriptional regulator n=1 Tax=Sulfuricurvum sp. TaxID=2025608 RepID=UPI00261616E0|nr:AraC family transcriptional regulator [Sulfuricurvum sp.]MDD3597223.1 AraC family transcriptional regulator [Sulfuricurvum sp.]
MTTNIDTYLQELKNIVQSKYSGDEYIPTDIDGLRIYRISNPTEMLATVYEPSICVIIQGAKAVGLGDELHGYDPYSYLLSSIHMPARVRVAEASADQPYMGLTITFTMEQIFDVLKDLGSASKPLGKPKRGLYFGDMQLRLLEPITRLVRLIDAPDDISIMTPLIIKEILYVLMRDEGGDFIRQFIMDGGSAQKVAQAITKIKENFKEPLNVKELARSVSMSESSLYHNFKKITAISPLQFQKHLRLHEARQMLMVQDIEAAQVAFEVGYESPSQFSREYARMFGLPPKADIKQFGK